VNAGDLPYFLGLMEHIAATGFTCPTPVHARDGIALRTLAGRPAAIVTFLNGMWPRRINPGHCAALGKALAEFHQAGADFAMTRPNNLSIEGWRPLANRIDPVTADLVQPRMAKSIGSELSFLEANWPKDLPRGTIHADVFPDNVFFSGDKLTGFIDFYFACTDALAYDIAICLNAWCFDPDGAFMPGHGRALLNAYQSARKLSDAELAALPILARGAALRFLLTRLYDWINHPPGALVKKKNPLEYYRKLAFHRSVRSVADYGAA
jgi:homoserine kinase type II